MKDSVPQTYVNREKTEGLPLIGRRILITRARGQIKEITHLLEGYGAQVIAFPTIEIVPTMDWRPTDQAIEKLDTYDWIIFTSANGAKYFIQRLIEKGVHTANLAKKKICAIGPRTQKELERIGLRVYFRPSEYRAEGIIEGLKIHGIQGQKILLPRAREARMVLPAVLREAGALMDEVEVYRTVKPAQGKEFLAAILQEGIDVVGFTSSSTVRNFMELLPDKNVLNGVKVAVIGPVTGEIARNYGLEPCIAATEYTIPSMVQAIVEHFSHQSCTETRKGDTNAVPTL
jgi:uroporphyrinogen III methyltransferase/synthase